MCEQHGQPRARHFQALRALKLSFRIPNLSLPSVSRSPLSFKSRVDAALGDTGLEVALALLGEQLDWVVLETFPTDRIL